jgi:hypothetical protein
MSKVPGSFFSGKIFGPESHGGTEKMPTVVSFQHSSQQYLVVSPDGSRIEIPKELFGLLLDFLQGSKQTGSVVIQFRNGGIAGLEAVIKKTYK